MRSGRPARCYPHRPRQHFAQPPVPLARHDVPRAPAVVDLGQRQEAVGGRPEQPEAVPLRVGRHVPQEPAQAVGQAIVVVRHGHVPVGRALEDADLAGPVRQVRDELRRARPRADDAHRLAGEVDRVVPLGRMERRPLERPQARDVRQLGTVELPHRADHGLRLDRLLDSIRAPDLHPPQALRVVVGGAEHLGVEADVVADAELGGAVAEVLQQHVLRREVVGPVGLLGARVAVEVVRRVDPRPGVGVLEPGAADVAVLLDDRAGDARLLQPSRRHDARHPRADDDHAQRPPGVDLLHAPTRRPRVPVGEGQLLDQQRQVVVAHGLADEEVDHTPQASRRRRRRHHRPRVAPGDQRAQRQFARRRPRRLRQLALQVQRGGRRGPQVVAQQRQVARDLRQRRQQRSQMGALQRLADGLVVGRERVDRAVNRHGVSD